MMNNSVVYRANGTSHVVYQPNAEIELYLPAMEQPSPGLPNGTTLLVIPVTRPTFETLRDAWEWHLETFKESITRQHTQIDNQTLGPLTALQNQLGGVDAPRSRKLRLQA